MLKCFFLFKCFLTLIPNTFGEQHIGMVRWKGVTPHFVLLAFFCFHLNFSLSTTCLVSLRPLKAIQEPFWHYWKCMGVSGEIGWFIWFPGKKSVFFKMWDIVLCKATVAGRAGRICNVPMADQCSFIECQRNTPLTWAAEGAEESWVICLEQWGKERFTIDLQYAARNAENLEQNAWLEVLHPMSWKEPTGHEADGHQLYHRRGSKTAATRECACTAGQKGSKSEHAWVSESISAALYLNY